VIAMADTRQTSPDPELAALREEWAPTWTIWRARRDDDEPGEFLATRAEHEKGADRTIMQPTAALLDAALRLQERG
jgi:hypothetical protein